MGDNMASLATIYTQSADWLRVLLILSPALTLCAGALMVWCARHTRRLEFDAETDSGRSQFVMRWTQSQGVEFGDNGKLLIDTEDNRYVVHDVDELPKKDRERFLHYVYW